LPWGKAPGFFWSLAADIRRHLLALLERDLNPGPSRGVLEALLVGSQGGLTPEIENAFRATGLTHLLVVSGLHLTLVFLLFFLPIYLLFSLHEPWSESGRAKKGAMLAALGPTVLYAAVVGPGPSVARALMFSALAVFLFWRDWKWDVLSILLFSFGLSLACEPGALFDLSFQFSYLAVGMLFFSGRKIFLYFKNRIPRRSPARWGPLKWTATLLFTNLAINLALLPWMAEIFHEASAVAPLANLLFIPLFTFLIHPLSWMGALVDVLSSPGAGIFFRFLEFGLGRALRILEALASLPFASVLIPPLPRLFWAGYALLVAAFGLHPDWPRRWMAAGCLLMAVGIGWRSAKNEAGAGMLSLTMLDVGQGESLLVRTPEGSALLIDGGGFPYSDFDLGRQVILPELLGKRAGRLRAMVLTHPDADHLKGLTAVARRWNVAEFWYPRTAQEDPNLAPLLQIVMEAGIPPRALRSGDRVEVDQVDFEVLWPEIGSEKVFSDNNRSLVLKMCYREVCFYLMGDLEEEAEELLAFGPRRGAFRILKVGHHGSRTSTNYDFLQKLHPALALVSAGQDNRFHHPHPEVLKRLEESKVPLLRTDRQGQIEIRTDGRLVFYRTYSGERGMLVNSAPVPSWWVSTRRWVFE
jgi:competence protein ComEC